MHLLYPMASPLLSATVASQDAHATFAALISFTSFATEAGSAMGSNVGGAFLFMNVCPVPME